MTACPVCRQPVSEGRGAVHVCAPSEDLPPPPPPDAHGFVLPVQRSRWPMIVVLVLVLVSAIVTVWAVVSGGGDAVELAGGPVPVETEVLTQ